MRQLTTQEEEKLKVLTENYFVALVVSPEAHLGKGRFLLRMIQDELIKELS